MTKAHCSLCDNFELPVDEFWLARKHQHEAYHRIQGLNIVFGKVKWSYERS